MNTKQRNVASVQGAGNNQKREETTGSLLEPHREKSHIDTLVLEVWPPELKRKVSVLRH